MKGVTGRHGEGSVAVAGTGTLGAAGDRPSWDVRLAGKGLPVDDELRAALPESLRALCKSLALKGTIGFDLPRLSYRGPAPKASKEPTLAPDTAPAGAAPAAAEGPDLDVAGAVHLTDATLDVGVALEKVNGSVAVEATVRGGKLQGLRGGVDVASFSLAGRTVESFKATLDKPAGKDELLVGEMQGRLARGDLAGQVKLFYPDEGKKKYTLSLVVRNADVRELAQEPSKKIAGRVTASLAMEGDWDKPADRRGRGDVVMAGKDMYRIPLVLGLLQVTNLSLPISSPFESAVARYSVEGRKVIFENIELRSSTMLMTGEGQLDFGTKQVRMTFVTDNPGGFKIPFIQDIWRTAQHELLRIHVKGTVQEPKVEASTMGTLTTTVDEVFKGETPKPAKGKGKK